MYARAPGVATGRRRRRGRRACGRPPSGLEWRYDAYHRSVVPDRPASSRYPYGGASAPPGDPRCIRRRGHRPDRLRRRFADAGAAAGPAADGRGHPGPAFAADVENGARLFEAHCERCHGAGGAGDGPLAPGLSPRPPDWTRAGALRGPRPGPALHVRSAAASSARR
ncbi:MAG: cytochrome c [Anaerolineae bacterium]